MLVEPPKKMRDASYKNTAEQRKQARQVLGAEPSADKREDAILRLEHLPAAPVPAYVRESET